MNMQSFHINAITPSIIPESLRSKKLFNSGDLYVQQLTRKYLFENRINFNNISYWRDKTKSIEALLGEINNEKKSPLLVAGTNCLNNQFSLVKDVNPSLFKEVTHNRFIALCFVGLFGADHADKKHFFEFKQESYELLKSILSSGVISCRCKTTFDSLTKVFPEYDQNIYLTGCVSAIPVINSYKGFTLNSSTQIKVLFSVTCRNNSGIEEAKDLTYLIKIFGADSITMILNQNRLCRSIQSIVEQHNIQIFSAEKMNYLQYYNFLSSFDLHIGSRAHVHIPMCSLGIRTILTGFELRHTSFQKHYKNGLIACGTVENYTPSFLLYEKQFDGLKDALISDSLERKKFKNRIREEINISDSTFNVIDSNQWLARQQKALEILKALNVRKITELGPGFGKLADKLINNNIEYRGFDIIKRRDFVQRFDINTDLMVPPSGPDDC